MKELRISGVFCGASAASADEGFSIRDVRLSLSKPLSFLIYKKIKALKTSALILSFYFFPIIPGQAIILKTKARDIRALFYYTTP